MKPEVGLRYINSMGFRVKIHQLTQRSGGDRWLGDDGLAYNRNGHCSDRVLVKAVPDIKAGRTYQLRNGKEVKLELTSLTWGGRPTLHGIGTSDYWFYDGSYKEDGSYSDLDIVKEIPAQCGSHTPTLGVCTMDKGIKALESLKASGAFSAAQIAAMDTAIAVANGEKYVEGAVYKRVTPPGVPTCGDLYVATKKLAKKAGDDRSFDLLNLTHRDGVPKREVYSPAKFRKVADSLIGKIRV